MDLCARFPLVWSVAPNCSLAGYSTRGGNTADFLLRHPRRAWIDLGRRHDLDNGG